MAARGTRNSVWFSTYFGVNKPQHLLPFLDFLLDKDVPLYIDSYAITKDRSEFAARCHDAIISYFQALLKAVQSGQPERIKKLVQGHLSEPRELHLGFATVARTGLGLGRIQETQIVEALTQSQALRTGFIQDIQELELHIEGIGPDKISDLVANIIKGLLAEYTQQVCADYRIETRPECAVNNFWNSETLEWDAGYFDLPVRDNDAYILVPKRFVRCEEDTVNHQVFYDKYVLNILQREMVDASDALVETLKTGERRVTKRSLRGDGRFTPSKAYISQFIQEHPSVMDQYRNRLKNPPVPTDLTQVSGKAAEDDPAIQAMLNTVLALPPGSKHASEYHNAILELLQFVFDWCLQDFEKEYEMDQGRGRIDIVCNNAAGRGLFAELRTELNATSIPIECKNYSSDLGNDEFNQLNDRLGKKSSRLGFLFCRKIEKPQEMHKHLSDRWLRHENCLLLLDDTHLKQLVEMRLKRDYAGIESLLRNMIRDVKFASTPQKLPALNVADEAQPSSN